ncbi:collagen alpha-1(X) chain-like [Parambassis ranga]|uniref:Collagen alpha-1(X) chain-like n=1 Tax=Parambassis ranga TaxID=210632 RepID=A0A6P7IJK0_9TELE|nr:collagen alpha-1(X) chain-like [Parambassis ranga]
MSTTKISSLFVIGAVLCEACLVVAGPVGLKPSQTLSRQQGSAVLFFTAYQGQLREVLFNPIIFNQVLVNQGSAYDNNTGVFTAPVAGIYQFVFAAQLCRGDHNNMWNFMVNGNNKLVCHAQVSGLDTTLNTCYLMEELKKGDQVWVKQYARSCAWASTTSRTITFSGVLLASEGASVLGEKYGSGSSCPLPSWGSDRILSSSSAGRTHGLTSGVVIALLLSCFLFG